MEHWKEIDSPLKDGRLRHIGVENTFESNTLPLTHG